MVAPEEKTPPSDREIDLETSLEFFQEGCRIRDEALGAILKWVEREAAVNRWPMPIGLSGQVRRAMKGER